MSLFTFEEICEGCINAMWHGCGQCYQKWVGRGIGHSFCHCKINAEQNLNHCHSNCDFKRLPIDRNADVKEVL